MILPRGPLISASPTVSSHFGQADSATPSRVRVRTFAHPRLYCHRAELASLVSRLVLKELVKMCVYCWGHRLLYTFGGSVTAWMLLSGNLQYLLFLVH